MTLVHVPTFLHTLLLGVVLALLSSPNTLGSGNPQIQQAITKCRDKLGQDPTFPKAQHMLGMLLETTPGSDLTEIADLSFHAGVCEDRPLDVTSRVDALCRAGKTFLQLGMTDRARESYQKALRLMEDSSAVEDLLHQVTVLFFQETATLNSALELSELASHLTERFPLLAVAHQFEGAVHRKAGNLEAAFQSYHTASTLSQHTQEGRCQSFILAASAARQAGHDLDTQLQYLESALEHAGQDRTLQAEVWNNRGIAHKAAGNKKKAIVCFQSALDARPGDGHALAHLASLNAAQFATAFDADYVQGLFDGYSTRFEDELVNTLDYNGHKWVADELVRFWNNNHDENKRATVVDLGCGTGLVGEALMSRLIAATPPRLVGIDLSPRMIEKARLRTYQGNRVYDQLEQSDAETFLKRLGQGSVQAIVAADVFIYVGELEGVFSAGWDALSSTAGMLVFSIESTKEGMVLLPSGRFGHSRKYIEDVAERHGFDLKLWKEGILRKQHGAPVRGAVVVLQKNKKL